MVLKAEIAQAEYDGLPDDWKKEYQKMSGEHYRDDMFYLNVEKAGGFALEPVDGLKSALVKERAKAEDAYIKLKA